MVASSRPLVGPGGTHLTLLLAVSSVAVGLAIRRQHGDEDGRRGRSQQLVAAFKAFLLENACVCGIAAVEARMGLFPPKSRRFFLDSFLRQCLQSLLFVESTTFAQWALANLVYKDIPWFAPEHMRPALNWSDHVKEWCMLMIPVRLINASILSPVFHYVPDPQRYKEMSGFVKAGSKLAFLAKFALCRMLFDLTFYWVHRMIHDRRLYAMIHSKHHEHVEPSLNTNQHFTVLDLFLEGSAPLLAGLTGLTLAHGLGSPSTRFEATYTLVALLWYLNASHTGKQIPTATVFPPLAFIPEIDEGLGGGVQHHHQHHRVVRSNYGIASWPDQVFGTITVLRRDVYDKDKLG